MSDLSSKTVDHGWLRRLYMELVHIATAPERKSFPSWILNGSEFAELRRIAAGLPDETRPDAVRKARAVVDRISNRAAMVPQAGQFAEISARELADISLGLEAVRTAVETTAELTRENKAASDFIRGCIDALGVPPLPEGFVVNLDALLLQVIGEIESLKGEILDRDAVKAPAHEQLPAHDDECPCVGGDESTPCCQEHSDPRTTPHG